MRAGDAATATTQWGMRTLRDPFLQEMQEPAQTPAYVEHCILEHPDLGEVRASGGGPGAPPLTAFVLSTLA